MVAVYVALIINELYTFEQVPSICQSDVKATLEKLGLGYLAE